MAPTATMATAAAAAPGGSRPAARDGGGGWPRDLAQHAGGGEDAGLERIGRGSERHGEAELGGAGACFIGKRGTGVAGGDVRFERARFAVVEGAQCPGVDVFADQFVRVDRHQRSISIARRSASALRIFCMPSRIRVFTVPSGWPSFSAISDWVSPPK